MPGASSRRPTKAKVLPLTGADITYGAGFNGNGIVAKYGWLIMVKSNTGQLFRINPRTGASKLIDTHGYSVANGDGLVLRGRWLYVVRNQNNLVAVLKLGLRLKSARLARRDHLARPRHPDDRDLRGRQAVGRERPVHDAADADHAVLDHEAPGPPVAAVAPRARPISRRSTPVGPFGAGRRSCSCRTQRSAPRTPGPRFVRFRSTKS